MYDTSQKNQNLAPLPCINHPDRTPSIHYSFQASYNDNSIIIDNQLVNIPKVQILPISQIPKRSRVQIPPLQPALHRALQRVPALVLPRQDEAQGQDQGDFDQVRDDHAPDAELVARGL